MFWTSLTGMPMAIRRNEEKLRYVRNLNGAITYLSVITKACNALPYKGLWVQNRKEFYLCSNFPLFLNISHKDGTTKWQDEWR
jgi:hypothetical protein